MLKKVVIFKTATGEFCVINVPENYRRSDVRPRTDEPGTYPRFFPDHGSALAERTLDTAGRRSLSTKRIERDGIKRR